MLTKRIYCATMKLEYGYHLMLFQGIRNEMTNQSNHILYEYRGITILSVFVGRRKVSHKVKVKTKGVMPADYWNELELEQRMLDQKTERGDQDNGNEINLDG